MRRGELVVLRRRLPLCVGRYNNAETALMSGSMLRDCLKNPALAKCEPALVC